MTGQQDSTAKGELLQQGQQGGLSLQEEERKKTGSVRMFPESPERSDKPGTIRSKKSRKEARRFARRAEALRENLLRRRRQKHAARAVAQKEWQEENAK